jgi:hypothetical protein
MKTKSLVAALLFSSCLTILASYPSTITQENVNQIRPGQTTEADLVNLFGIPTTRFVDLAHYTAIDWFRSVPAPVQSYIPFIGPMPRRPLTSKRSSLPLFSVPAGP